MRIKGSAEFLENRRREALRLLGEGRSLHEVAGMIRCAASSVMRWREAWERGGEQAVKVWSSPGRPHKLEASQRRRLIALLRKGARAHGYKNGRWTTARIADIIKQHFGVTYHPDHIGRLMRGLGWTHETTRPRETKHDEDSTSDSRRGPWFGTGRHGWVPASSAALRRGSSRTRPS